MVKIDGTSVSSKVQNGARSPPAARVHGPLQARDQEMMCRTGTQLCRTEMDSLMRDRERIGARQVPRVRVYGASGERIRFACSTIQDW